MNRLSALESAPFAGPWPRILLSRWLLCGLGALAFGWLSAATHEFASPDEAWFLQVVNRVESGEMLYRDVYFGVTPLSVSLTRLMASLLGAEILVSRAVVMASFFLTVIICTALARRLRLTSGTRTLLVLGLLVYGISFPFPPPYTPLAVLFFVGSFLAAVVWCQDDRAGRGAIGKLAAAGFLGGFCFAAKQNLGIYALAALLVSVLAKRRRSGEDVLRDAAVLVLAFFAACVVALLPVWLGGGTDGLITYGFTSKGTYLELGQVSHLAPLQRLWGAIHNPKPHVGFALFHWNLVFLLPPLVFALLLAAWVRGRFPDRSIAAILTAFVIAGYLVVYPRPGSSHVIYAVPVLLVGLGYAWGALRPSIPLRLVRFAHLAAAVWLSAGLLLWGGRSAVHLLTDRYVFSTIPHFRGMLIQRDRHQALRQQAAALARAVDGRPALLVGRDACFYYLAARVKNPSAFDFPYASVFGPFGQEEVIRGIRENRIRAVFLFFDPVDRQSPVRIQNYVRERMAPVRKEEFGVLYSFPSSFQDESEMGASGAVERKVPPPTDQS